MPHLPPAARTRATAATFMLLLALAAAGPVSATYQLGDVVEDFTLPDLQNNPVSLSDYAGDIVLVNFFATWCPGCNVEAAILEHDIHRVYQEHGVTVLAVNMQEPLATVQNWVAAQGVTYQIVRASDWDIFARFPRAGGYPYNAIIDRDGVLRYGQVLFDEEAILGTLNALLGFDPVPVAQGPFGSIKALFR